MGRALGYYTRQFTLECPLHLRNAEGRTASPCDDAHVRGTFRSSTVSSALNSNA